MSSSFLTIRRATGGSSFRRVFSAAAASWTAQAKALFHVGERRSAARPLPESLDRFVVVELLQSVGDQSLHQAVDRDALPPGARLQSADQRRGDFHGGHGPNITTQSPLVAASRLPGLAVMTAMTRIMLERSSRKSGSDPDFSAARFFHCSRNERPRTGAGPGCPTQRAAPSWAPLTSAGEDRGEPAGKKAKYPDRLPGIPLLLPRGRRPAQARFQSSTLRAEINAPVGVVFGPGRIGRGTDPGKSWSVPVLEFAEMPSVVHRVRRGRAVPEAAPRIEVMFPELVGRSCNLKPYTRVPVPKAKVQGEVITYASPDSTFAVTKRLFDAARRSILIGIYDFTAPHVKQLVSDALARGVKVRLMLDIDSAEEQALFDDLVTLGMQGVPAPSCASQNGNPYFRSSHEKLIVIDEEWVLVQSGNYSANSCPLNVKDGGDAAHFVPGNRDSGLAVRSRPLAKFFSAILSSDMALELGGPPAAEAAPRALEAFLVERAPALTPSTLYPSKIL